MFKFPINENLRKQKKQTSKAQYTTSSSKSGAEPGFKSDQVTCNLWRSRISTSEELPLSVQSSTLTLK